MRISACCASMMMESGLLLADAYQRLLGEAARRMGAVYAELMLRADTADPPAPIARYGMPPADDAVCWESLSVGGAGLGALRLAFAPECPPPGSEALRMAHALAELGQLLLVERPPDREADPQTRRHILAINEEELQRIILDIHDGPIQKLFVVSSRLALLQARMAEWPAEQRQSIALTVVQLTGLVEAALQELRATLNTFRPAEFQRRTLPAILQGLAFQHEVLTGNQVDLYIAEPIPSVSLPVKIALYRVLQEALSNSYRHAGVDMQEVYLSSRDGWITLEVCDDGIGFTPPQEREGAAERAGHIGLHGMRERVHLVGGQLQIISEPGHGTQIVVRVPGGA